LAAEVERARQKPLETVPETNGGYGTYPRALPATLGEVSGHFRYGEFVAHPYVDPRVLFPFLKYLRDSIPMYPPRVGLGAIVLDAAAGFIFQWWRPRAGRSGADRSEPGRADFRIRSHAAPGDGRAGQFVLPLGLYLWGFRREVV
jgi:hypothetical protein